MTEAATFRDNVLEKPEVFFTPSEEVATTIAQFTKYLFDQAKECPATPKTPLETLYVDGFDTDQIWEQLKLQNEPVAKEVGRQVKRVLKNPQSIVLFHSGADDDDAHADEDAEVEDETMNDDDEEDDAKLSEEEEEDDMDDDDEEVMEKRVVSKKASKKRKRTPDAEGVEDGFFDWDEMEKAAEVEENEASDDDDGVDLEDDDEDEDDEDEDGLFEDGAVNEKEATYKDFFAGGSDEEAAGSNDDEEDNDEEQDNDADEADDSDAESAPKDSRKRPALTEDEEEDEAERGIMSSHQRRMQSLHSQIESLEEEALGDKPWALKGEVKAAARPENSLLEATLEYDRPTRVAPTITVEVTQALEDLIKERIREDQYDDVVRKFAANDAAQREVAELSMEKSKEGLGEIYEKEYMKNAMGFEDNSDMKKEQEEIEAMFQKLCWKLDALSNFHFTPKPVVREMQVQSTAPAISMEEAVPIGVSDATMAAPEEVYDKKRKRDAVVRSREEMTQEERKATRNAKKHARRKARAQKAADERLVAKVNPGMGNKYEKKKMLESLDAKNVTKGKEIEGSTKQFSKSSEFFTKLQEDTAKTIDEHREAKVKAKKASAKSAAFYKL
ncbi:U3 small nucleolar ribonucleoprotein [Achlya hypogyna]|uniref:U3 small nucleolar ribonucleoprotein protein MPP10 n=1 Tax=Achlya hypogyna TaxID=1202772 RepID=A0A1V9Z983_ACHHY|nr:U3 small nucleolar ribonucleoprotein [Achlya hypogyna]